MGFFNNYYPIAINNDNDLDLKHKFLSRTLKIVLFFAIFLALIRLIYPNQTMLLVDISLIITSVISLHYLNKSITLTLRITNILLVIFFILTCFMFSNQELYILGPTWFILMILFAFYQAGITKGIITIVSSVLAIVILAQFFEEPYSLPQYLYSIVPFLVAAFVIYLYESKVIQKENLLHIKNLDLEKLLQEKESLLHHAHHDALTKLPNRILFQDRLKHAIAKTNRSNKDFAVLFIDLDLFKEINDTKGHTVGDLVLCEIASRLKRTLRKEDTISRFGGDEFSCIIEQVEDCDSVAKLAQKLIERTREEIIINESTITLTCSIGISIYKKDSKTEIDLLHHADTAMYKAKDLGKDNYQFYTPC